MSRDRSAVTRRIVGAAVAVAAVASGVLVHLGAPDGAASDIAGDALYVIAVWGALVALLLRLSPWVVGAIVLAWCVAVELFQLSGWPLRWAGEWPPIVLVFGTVFDPRDLLVYAVTASLVTVVDVVVRRSLNRRRG